MSAHTLHPGDRVADRYLIVDRIAQGGFGEVYLAVQESVQRHVALKTLRVEH
jgi:serine/threonine protein kinase